MSLRFNIPVTLGSLGRGFHLVPEVETARDPAAAPPPIDYTPLITAGRQIGLWLLGVARTRTDDPDDLQAIARMERAATARDGAPSRGRAEVDEADLLTVLGLVMTAFEDDLAVPGMSTLAGALYATDGDLSLIQELLGGVLAERDAAEAHRTVCVPIVVRRRPRVAYQLDDLHSGR